MHPSLIGSASTQNRPAWLSSPEPPDPSEGVSKESTVCAVSEVWSGLKLVIRKTERK